MKSNVRRTRLHSFTISYKLLYSRQYRIGKRTITDQLTKTEEKQLGKTRASKAQRTETNGYLFNQY